MKVCIVGSSGVPIPPKYGGAVERHIFDLARTLVKMGHDVRILTMGEEGEEKDVVVGGVYVHRISKYYPSGSLKSLWKHIAFFSSILKSLGGYSPFFDVLHAHNGISGFAVWIVSRLRRVPFIYTSHLPFTNIHHKAAWGESFLTNRFNDIQNLLEKFCVRHADYVIAISRFVKEGLLVVGVKEEKITVIPNGVNVEQFRFSPETAKEFREKFRLSDKRVILFVGRIVSYKGLDTLVEAASYVINAIRNVIFLVVGPISYYGGFKHTEYYLGLQRKIEDKGLEEYFLFTGALNDREMVGAYSACEILVLPSISEGFGMVLAEANACAKPVITTSCGGTVDIVRDGYNGFLTPIRDVKVLADSIINLLTDRSLARVMGKNGRRLMEEKFSWESIALRVKKVYEESSRSWLKVSI